MGAELSTVANAMRRRWWCQIWGVLTIVALIYLIAVLTGPHVGEFIDVLTPPRMPSLIPVTAQVWRGDQSWTASQAEQFHFEAQGTHTLPLPLSWFLALERPLDSPFAIPFGTGGRFADNGYLLRFGFIGAYKSKYNSYGLPIGFAVSPYQTIPGIPRKETAVGLTCAACHTGQLIYGGKQYIVDGGPAVTDVGQLSFALRAALGQTALSEKLPFFDGRFERFARSVLGSEYNDITRDQLAKDLDSLVKLLAGQPTGIDVAEGFARLDALNRIGNQVFALDTQRYDNYVNINAPVHYPRIWTSPWFSWVQYDGSIMQPLVRNAGEAMGVSAGIDFAAPPGAGRFASSMPFRNLEWIEDQLRGKSEPLVVKAFTGLNGPKWPKEFPSIDAAKAAEGARLYDKHCKGCHLPALTPDIASGKAPDAEFWKNFGPIKWTENGVQKQTTESVLKVKVIKQKHIGTDPAEGAVLAGRLVNTAGADLLQAGRYSPGLGIDATICLPGNDRNALTTAHITDYSLQPYPIALGAVVQMSIDEWVRRNNPNAAELANLVGDRPNCLRSGGGYKARPLNGVWATAPFLHNGSVPTLYDLLSPVKERPKVFLLGDPHFDPVHVGLETRTGVPKDGSYEESGYFVLDTSKPGNRNTGHEFSNEKHQGVIGPALSPEERYAIIEFLKSI